ncbi:S4 domain-containing protein [Buchnera aphidicola]|uniref:S4 domain-containing protein n=1 Tax=Buchnera aphidicola TaxID=9 RepID=UPI001E38E17B|nr:S4 domain-containing protein [Buchnera aphidicola]
MCNLIKLNFLVSLSKLKYSRLDKILVQNTSLVSRSCIKKWILLGYVSVNNVIVTIPKKKFFLMIIFQLM